MTHVAQASSTTKTINAVRPTDTKIQETTDYSVFRFLKHNRPVVVSHVARLSQSMLDRPHLRVSRPVLCNDKMEVIDGQHRFRASELNGQSVFFMTVPGLSIEDARLLNALQRTWSLLDYAYSYASSRVPAYVQYVRTYEARNLPPSVVLEYMSGGSSKTRHNFRVGELRAVDQTDLNHRLDMLEQVLEQFPKAATPYIVSMAFHTALKNEDYDHNRMMRKLSNVHPEPQADRVAYIRELERIYNTDVQFGGPNYIRFF